MLGHLVWPDSGGAALQSSEFIGGASNESVGSAGGEGGGGGGGSVGVSPQAKTTAANTAVTPIAPLDLCLRIRLHETKKAPVIASERNPTPTQPA